MGEALEDETHSGGADVRATVAELCHAIGARPVQGNTNAPFSGASLDTRSLRRGNVFFAVKGTRTDGHRYVSAAARRGAAAAVVERRVAAVRRFPVLCAASAERALRDGAAWYRRELRAPVIGVTGSNGKTTVKDLARWVLSGAMGEGVLATERSLNNHLGVALTLFAMRRETRAAVVEMAMNRPGEIRSLARMAAPAVGVVLNAGRAHMGRFADVAGVARAKAELIEELPAGGWAILNADDPAVWRCRRLTAARVLGFGIRRGDIRAAGPALDHRGAPRFRLRTPQGDASVRLRMPGRHSAANAAAAAAVGWVFGMSPRMIARRLSGFVPRAAMRLERRRLRRGALAIVDCYNANPDSCRAALSYLRDIGARRPVLVLGEMLELGRHSRRMHREIGRLAARLRPRLVVGVGRGAGPLVAAARKEGAGTVWTDDPEAAAGELSSVLSGDTVVLFKASRKVGLERLVERLQGRDRGNHAV